jgi:CBS domain containing-hemolysin-like protein
MTATIVNLLLALFLLAANAFYVAAEFALVKSRGFRISAMAEQNRFGARLLKKMVGNIEAYLACCQLGITMASLGLGWIGEPTVSAFLWPVLVPLGMSESALHFTSFWSGSLYFPHCISSSESKCLKLWRSGNRCRYRSGSRIPFTCRSYCCTH